MGFVFPNPLLAHFGFVKWELNLISSLDCWIVLVRYPYEEAAEVAISTIKEFANDIKEVFP